MDSNFFLCFHSGFISSPIKVTEETFCVEKQSQIRFSKSVWTSERTKRKNQRQKPPAASSQKKKRTSVSCKERRWISSETFQSWHLGAFDLLAADGGILDAGVRQREVWQCRREAWDEAEAQTLNQHQIDQSRGFHFRLSTVNWKGSSSMKFNFRGLRPFKTFII